MNTSALALDGVRKIAVLGPGPVGDFVFALPALHALKHTYPAAELVLVGNHWQLAFLKGRPGPVDRVVVMPPFPGVGAPPDAQLDPGPAHAFLRAMRDARFDLAFQMFGGGRYSNPLVAQFGARLSIGVRAADATPLDRWLPYIEPNNRRLALLELVALAGAQLGSFERELAIGDDDRSEASLVLPPAPGHPLVLMQPGASDPRRRWPPERFAAVADALVREGAQVAVNGIEPEAPLVRAVIGSMRCGAVDLSGRLSLSGLCGLLERAALLVSNDTGPLHLALAIGTPSVGIFWLTNLLQGGPLRQSLLRAALSVRVHCPVCGAPNRSTRCAHDVSFVDDVPEDEVTSMATSLLHAGR